MTPGPSPFIFSLMKMQTYGHSIGCRVNRLGDQIVFGWTPSSSEASVGYAKFRVTLVDINNSVWTQVLNFKIKSVNQPPVFKSEIPDTVFMAPTGDLILDFAAVDPDHDNLTYDFTLLKLPLLLARSHR